MKMKKFKKNFFFHQSALEANFLGFCRQFFGKVANGAGRRILRLSLSKRVQMGFQNEKLLKIFSRPILIENRNPASTVGFYTRKGLFANGRDKDFFADRNPT
jgi:hypothetical protein